MKSSVFRLFRQSKKSRGFFSLLPAWKHSASLQRRQAVLQRLPELRSKYNEQSAKGESNEADAQDEVRQAVCDCQHVHGNSIQYQYQDQGIPALQLIIDKSKADSSDHICQGHDADTHCLRDRGRSRHRRNGGRGLWHLDLTQRSPDRNDESGSPSSG